MRILQQRQNLRLGLLNEAMALREALEAAEPLVTRFTLVGKPSEQLTANEVLRIIHEAYKNSTETGKALRAKRRSRRS